MQPGYLFKVNFGVVLHLSIVLKAKNHINLVILSIITQMESCSLRIRGKVVIKYKLVTFNFHVGILILRSFLLVSDILPLPGDN